MQSELPSDTAQGVAGDDLKSSTAPPSSLISAPSQSPSSGRVVVTLADSPPTAPDDKTVIRNRPPQGEVPTRTSASPQHIGEMLIGKQLDHYELIEFVGGGGMGAVFRANDMRLGRNVAVKVLSRDQSDEETIRRFRNEAQSAARLDHPNIARVHYVGESQGWNYIVFEFIEGVNLRDLVDDLGPLSLEDALSYTLQIAEALAHSSGRDVVHRDIKPSNVLIMAGGQAKLVDMGLARLHQVESSSDDLTASGVTLGTFDYISPEQARDPRAADVRSDIYSLGCTLYYTLTGQPPFPDGTALQKLLRHNAEEPPDVRLFRPELSPLVTQLLTKMLAKRPGQRFQSPNELIAELVTLGQKLGISNLMHRGQVGLPTARDSNHWRSSAWQIAAAVGVLAVAVVVVDALLSAGHDRVDVRLRPKLAAPNSGAPVSDATQLIEEPMDPLASDSTSPGSASRAGTESATTTAPASVQPGRVVLPAASPAVSAVSSPAGEEGTASASIVAIEESSDPEAASGGGFALSAPPVNAGVDPVSEGATLEAGPELSGALGLPPPPRKINHLIVAPQAPAVVPADTEYIASLAAACRRAAELGLTEVALQWTGRQIETRLEITNQRLTLRAAAGYKPIIVFRPEVTGLELDREMIRLAGGSTSRLSLEGLELRLELPGEPSFGWSLLTMQTGQTLELSDCVITVQNAGEIHDGVAMVAVQARRTSDTMSMPELQPSMSPSTTLSLNRCIARGEATFVSLIEETPLDIRWNQGLLVTPRHMIETGGAMNEPDWYEDIEIDLVRVTASCRQGLYQMKRRQGTNYQFAVDVSTDHCVLVTDPDSPFYEFIGVTDIQKKHLQCAGEGNLISRPDVIFLRFGMGSSAGSQTFKFGARDPWSVDEAQPRIPWLREPDLTAPAHLQVKSAFELVETLGVDADAGFDPAQLPDVAPPAPVLPAASAAPPQVSPFASEVGDGPSAAAPAP